jgi:uncharacterized SAM-binding protein YcdF (DUF218 family)
MSDLAYFFYKAVSQFIMPLGLGLVALCYLIWLIHRGRIRPARMLAIFLLGWMWLWSTPLWCDLLRGSLERAYPYKSPDSYPDADAIVVLGGGVRGYAGSTFPVIDLNRASDRELFAAQLYKAGKARAIILSGGADPIYRTGAAAVGMKIFLMNLGIPSRAIHLGTKSRNTVENAQEVVAMLKPMKGRKILLVTSALHMKRAVWLFSRSDLQVIPAPTDFEVMNIPFSIHRILPDVEAFENSTRAYREYVGMVAHWFGFN